MKIIIEGGCNCCSNKEDATFSIEKDNIGYCLEIRTHKGENKLSMWISEEEYENLKKVLKE